ncbi:MAG: hypothetical protein WBV67_09530 [Candidatus Cybelea sp.]
MRRDYACAEGTSYEMRPRLRVEPGAQPLDVQLDRRRATPKYLGDLFTLPAIGKFYENA